MDYKKKPLCKFKEKCPQWMAKKDCGFDHVLCKFNQSCKDKQKCMFYHMPKPVFDKPKSQTICKFGKNCNKRDSGCPFKHQINQQQNQPNIKTNQKNQGIPPKKQNKICRFDATCSRSDCKFFHPSRQNQNPEQSNQPKIQMPRMRVQQQQISQNNNQMNMRQISSQYCIPFIFQNNCQNGDRCQRPHEFSIKNSIKRIFFSTQIPQSDYNIVFYEHKKLQEGQNNKQIIYAVQQKQTISFRKLISSQNLYKDFGGIGPNQTNKTYLRSITNQLFKAQAIINGIEAFSYNQNQYLVFLAGNKTFIQNTTKGEVISFTNSREGNRLTGLAFVPQKNTLLIGTSVFGIKKFQFNTSTQKFQQKNFDDLGTGLKSLKMTDFQVLGQKIIYGITNSNQLLLMNLQFRFSLIQFANGATLNDADLCIINNKVPVVLSSITFGPRQHHIIAVNLLNLQKQTIMQYEYTSGINKILTIEGHLMIEIKSKGFLVYKLNEFQKQIGIIPFLNQIQQVRKDNKGNLLILEKTSISGKGSLSIFKIKKV